MVIRPAITSCAEHMSVVFPSSILFGFGRATPLSEIQCSVVRQCCVHLSGANISSIATGEMNILIESLIGLICLFM